MSKICSSNSKLEELSKIKLTCNAKVLNKRELLTVDPCVFKQKHIFEQNMFMNENTFLSRQREEGWI